MPGWLLKSILSEYYQMDIQKRLPADLSLKNEISIVSITVFRVMVNNL